MIAVPRDSTSGKTSSPPAPDKTCVSKFSWIIVYSKCMIPASHITSRDAYMLVYARSTDENSSTQNATGMTASPKQKSDIRSPEIIYPTPPQRALQVVEDLNTQHIQSCEDYVSRRVPLTVLSGPNSLKLLIYRRDAAETRFQSTRQRVIDIYRSWQLSSNSEVSVHRVYRFMH